MIKEGDYFVMVDNSGYHRVVQAGNNKIQNANKCMIDVGMVIGQPWESVFKVTDRQSGALEAIDEPQSEITHEFFTGLDENADAPMEEAGENAAAANADGDAPVEEMKDNRNLNDRNTA